MHHVPNETLVHILCREGTSNESTQKSKGSFVDERCGDTDPHGHRDRGSQWHRKQLPPHLPFPQLHKSELSPHCWLCTAGCTSARPCDDQMHLQDLQGLFTAPSHISSSNKPEEPECSYRTQVGIYKKLQHFCNSQWSSVLIFNTLWRSAPRLLPSHLCFPYFNKLNQLKEKGSRTQPSSIPCVKVVTAVPGFSLFST